MIHRSRALRAQQQRRISTQAQSSRAVDFFNVLTGPELLEVTETHSPEHRERLYPPTVTLAMFMGQALNADGSCQRAVNAWAAQRSAEGLNEISVGTGAYCKARQRLPLKMVRALAREAGRQLSTRAPSSWLWRDRRVKLLDGTTVVMPDTPDNQARYPQPRTQARGLGFPIARIAGVVCLSSGAMVDAAIGPYKGMGGDERTLARGLIDNFHASDVVLADAYFCSYFWIAALQARGVDILFEQHGARLTDFRRGTSLGARDHLVRWSKPLQIPPWMSQEQYQAFPDELLVREVKVKGRVLVTTLRDARTTPKQELGELYRQRWNVELDVRNIKTTMQMEQLSCHSAAMNEKEIWVHLLAYNLIRLLMAQAAANAGTTPRALSFKHTVQLWSQWHLRPVRGCSIEHSQRLFRLIAAIRVGNRPGRIEPRMLKRRPKPFGLLSEPRDKARARVRKYGHVWE